MIQLITHNFRRAFSRFTLSWLLILTTIFNSIAPAFLFATPAFAATTNQPVSISYDHSSHNFILSGPGSTEYRLYYQTSTKVDGAQGTLPATVYAGTQSTGVGTPEIVKQGIFKTSVADSIISTYFVIDGSTLHIVATPTSQTLDLTDSESKWLNEPTTYSDLVTGTTYHAPFNQDVSVTFTSLPANPGTVTFHQVTLTAEQVKESGALTSVAYEITSDMADGTFTYTLTLPNPSRKTGVGVQYSEDGKTFTAAASVSAAPSSVTIPGLTHFTIFVVVYDSTPSVNPVTSYQSLGFQATQTSEFGDYVHLAESARQLGKVTVTMVTWAKFSTYMSDPRYLGNAAGWTHPITLNIYSSHLGSNGAPDQLLTTSTQTVAIPWRPADDPACSGARWMDSYGNCNNGYAFEVSFDFSSSRVILPNDVIVGISYNTGNYGPAPVGVAGPYNSLNVAVPANQPIVVGSDDNVDQVFWNTVTKTSYADGGAAGFGVFRKDTNWTPNGTVAFKIETLPIPPCTTTSSFDSFALGSVNGQGGWSITGPYDQAVVNNSYGYPTFGCKTLRISDAVTSGSFGDQAFAPSTANGAGETTATAGTFGLGTRQNHFETQFDVASAVPGAQQPGMHISISPDRGDGSRMSYLRVEDGPAGLDVFFDDVQGTSNPANFVETTIASGLDRSIPHTFKLSMDFVEGPSNDTVKVYIDGALVHTGTSWENYYRYDSESSFEQSPRIVKTVLFRESGSATQANASKGFLIDNFSSSASIVIPSVPTATLTAGSLNVPNNGYTNSANFTFHLISSPYVSRYQLKYWNDIPGSVYKIETPWNPSDLSAYSSSLGVYNDHFTQGDGKHYFAFSACDAAGHCSAYSDPFIVNYDHTTPSIPVLTWPIGGAMTSDNTPLMQWNDSTDNLGIAGYLYRVYYHCTNPSIFATCTSVYPSTAGLWLTASQYQAGTTADGVYYWQVRAQDLATNQSDWSSVEKVTIDTHSPAAPTITFPSAEQYFKTSPILNQWSAVTDSSGIKLYRVEYIYDDGHTFSGGPYRTTTGTSRNHSPAISEQGGVTIRVQAEDNAGNTSAWSAPIHYTYDATTPVLSSKTPFEGWYNAPQTATFTYTDAKSPIVSGTPVTCSITTEGSNQTCHVTPNVCDAAGNCNTTPVTSNGANLDFTNPKSTITLPSNTGNNSTLITNQWTGSIAGTVSDNLSGVLGVQVSIQNVEGKYYNGVAFVDHEGELLLDAHYNEDGGWSYDGLTDPSEGSYTIKSHATDLAGNVENTYTLTIILDKTIPEVQIALNPSTPDGANGWYLTQPTITLTGTDANFGRVEYQWDTQSGPWITYAAPFKPSSEGAHVLYYRALDLADNYSAVGIKNIKWDQTALTDGPLNITVSPNPTSGTTSKVTWDAAKDAVGISQYEIQWKLGSLTHTHTVDSDIRSYELTDLTEGIWSVLVRAYDAAGHTKEASTTLTVDRTAPAAPTLTLTGTDVGSASLSWNAVSGASKYLVWYGTTSGSYLYGANVGNVTNFTVHGLGAGNYYFIVRAHDEAGNGSSNSNEVSTGTIAGAAGSTPGTPATGFTTTPTVLGESTTNVTTALDASPSPSPAGSVLGVVALSWFSQLMSRWWFWLIIILIIGYAIYRRWTAKRS